MLPASPRIPPIPTALPPFPKPVSITALRPLLSRLGSTYDCTSGSFPRGMLSRAGRGTVAEPLVVPQYPFSPFIITELKLSPGLLRTKTTFPCLSWSKIHQQWCPEPLESTWSHSTSEAAVPSPTSLICQIFFMGQTLLTASSLSIPASSFSGELGFCSGRQCAALKFSPSQMSLQGSHMTQFWLVRCRRKSPKGSWEAFCFPDADTTTLSPVVLWLWGCEAVRLEREQPFYDQRATLKRKGAARTQTT